MRAAASPNGGSWSNIANAEVEQWRSLQRWTGERDDLPEVIAAIGALVSDRSAKRPTRSRPSVELDRVRAMAC
ncbi:hypothetical protein [Kitasatospora sp. RG8]|uniref:hypothetical protein n=1 Tax=Kitasatospora sp. RG8 TaxID=2820815 RepID=UPI0027DC4F43|nr:hypothetical protein [Kitasatospora sp. RG8]